MKAKLRNSIGTICGKKRGIMGLFQQQSRNSQVCPHMAAYTPQSASTEIQPFDDIPEVKGHPVIGTLLDYMPWNGFQIEHIFELWKARHEKYGDIFKEKMFSTYMVYCRSPEDTERMFRSEPKAPTRFKIDGMSRVKKWMELPESMINMEGDDWLRMRQEINHSLLKPKMVWRFTRQQQHVCKDLVSYIRRHRDKDGEVPNFSTILDAWALEMSGVFLLNTRLGLLESSVDENMLELFQGTKKIMDFVTSTVHGMGLWNFKQYREIRDHAIRSRDIIVDIIKRQSKNCTGSSLLGNIMKSTALTEKEKVSLIYDVLCGSIETTANAIALVLYCVTLKEEIQGKLRDEVMSLASPDLLEGKDVDGMRYIGGFFKEVARLYPLAHGHIRTLRHDSILSGYRIPAGTIVHNTANSTQNRNPKYFSDPDEFLPERWLTKDRNLTKFATTGPFGMGPRACPGRRFAAQEIRLLLIELLKNFKVEYHHQPMVSLFRGTGTASEKPRFSFVPLD